MTATEYAAQMNAELDVVYANADLDEVAKAQKEWRQEEEIMAYTISKSGKREWSVFKDGLQVYKCATRKGCRSFMKIRAALETRG